MTPALPDVPRSPAPLTAFLRGAGATRRACSPRLQCGRGRCGAKRPWRRRSALPWRGRAIAVAEWPRQFWSAAAGDARRCVAAVEVRRRRGPGFAVLYGLGAGRGRRCCCAWSARLPDDAEAAAVLGVAEPSATRLRIRNAACRATRRASLECGRLACTGCCGPVEALRECALPRLVRPANPRAPPLPSVTAAQPDHPSRAAVAGRHARTTAMAAPALWAGVPACAGGVGRLGLPGLRRDGAVGTASIRRVVLPEAPDREPASTTNWPPPATPTSSNWHDAGSSLDRTSGFLRVVCGDSPPSRPWPALADARLDHCRRHRGCRPRGEADAPR